MIHFLDNEIDGVTLGLMDSVEKIATIIPKLKYQLIFLKERESLMTMINSNSSHTTDQSSALPSISTGATFTHQATSGDAVTHDQSMVANKATALFPDKYVVPPMPDSLLKDVADGQLQKFGPHYTNRQVLIDAIAHDLIDQFQLL